MKISITITDATPEEAAVFFQAYAINRSLPPGYAEALKAYRPPTECDGPGSEAPYGDEFKPAQKPAGDYNTMGNTIVGRDGSRRDSPEDKGMENTLVIPGDGSKPYIKLGRDEESQQKVRKPRAKKEEKAEEKAPEAPAAPAQIPVVPPTPILPAKASEVSAEAAQQIVSPDGPTAPTGPVISPEDLRADMQALYLTGAKGAAASAALLKEFGVKRLAELREDQRNAFKARIDTKTKEVANG